MTIDAVALMPAVSASTPNAIPKLAAAGASGAIRRMPAR
jgi:hypothetical protein